MLILIWMISLLNCPRCHSETINIPCNIWRLAAGAGLDVVKIDLIEGRPEYLRFSVPTYLLGWLYERLVNQVPGLWRLRVLLIAELRKPL